MIQNLYRRNILYFVHRKNAEITNEFDNQRGGIRDNSLPADHQIRSSFQRSLNEQSMKTYTSI